MELLIPLLLVLLLVAGLVTLLVLNATRKSGAAQAGARDGEDAAAGRPDGPRFRPEDDADEPAAPASERLANREP